MNKRTRIIEHASGCLQFDARGKIENLNAVIDDIHAHFEVSDFTAFRYVASFAATLARKRRGIKTVRHR